MAYKKKADCTPEEWEKFSEKRKANRKNKADYTPEEWEERLAKRRAYRKRHDKRKKDYTEEEWEEHLKKERQYRASRIEYFREYSRNRKHKCKDDYTEEEWENRLKKSRERRMRLKSSMSEEEWELFLVRERSYGKKYREKMKALSKRRVRIQKHKCDYSDDEWAKIRERKRKTIKHKKDYTEEEWNKIREKHRINAQIRSKHKKDYTEEEWRSILDARKKYYKKVSDMTDEEYKKYKEKRKIYQDKSYYNTKNKFEKYADKLTIDEDPICDKDGYIMVRDFLTKEYFYPARIDLERRIQCLIGNRLGESHLYASEKSKQSCPVYNAKTNIDINKQNLPPIDSFWRETVIDRANGHCERCGKASDVLHAHHIIPKGVCGMLEEDFDNGIALCPECHLGEGGVHDIDGCRLHELAAEKRKTA